MKSPKVIISVSLTLALSLAVLCLYLPGDLKQQPNALFMKVESSVTFDDEEKSFVGYISKFSRSYMDKEEYEHRKGIFQDNLRTIEEHNQKSKGRYQLAINQFAELTSQEFKDKVFGKSYKPKKEVYLVASANETQSNETNATNSNATDMNATDTNATSSNDTQEQPIPDTIDWRDWGAVSDVKNQGGSCSSHWAMAVADSVESSLFIETGETLQVLSTQQLVDCVPSVGYTGCYDNMDLKSTFQYVLQNGLETESSYPYTGADQDCSYDSNKLHAKLVSITYPKSNAPTDLKKFVASQPVAAEVEADQTIFQYYSSGVLDDNDCGYQVQHKVLIVGYGMLNNQNYWIVKNNWGTTWGESGYIRLAIKDGPGICGIHINPMFGLATKA